jgi:hypothetical protein
MARGGFRPGAGRPKSPSGKSIQENEDVPEIKRNQSEFKPLDYMLSVMNDDHADDARRDRMAIAAAPYVHPRVESQKLGKKDQQKQAAEKVASKYDVPSAPKLAVDNTR